MNLSRISKRIGLGDTEEFYGQSSLESLGVLIHYESFHPDLSI